MWFQDGDGKGAYFGLDGQSKQRSFLASPLEFSRVTSGFAMRMHPILNTWKQHNGVDYGAPSGTPVRTVGDGVVEFAGWQNGYGNVVQVRTATSAPTVYAHLSRVDVAKGEQRRAGRHHRRGRRRPAGRPARTCTSRSRSTALQQDPLLVAQSSEARRRAGSKARFGQLAQSVRASWRRRDAAAAPLLGDRRPAGAAPRLDRRSAPSLATRRRRSR